MNRLALLHGFFSPPAFVCRRCQRAALASPSRPLRLGLVPSHTPAARAYASTKKQERKKRTIKATSRDVKPEERKKLGKKLAAKKKNRRLLARKKKLLKQPKPGLEDPKPAEEPGSPISSIGEGISKAMKADQSQTYEVLKANNLKLGVVSAERPPVPKLAHGLDRVLFNPGVIQLRDPRSRVYNFGPHLEKLMPIREFDFNTLTLFTPPSRDAVLAHIAQDSGKKYIASTSSMTGALKHFHFLLSRFRPPNFDMLSRSFPTPLQTYTKMTRAPDAIFLRWKDGVYAVDADKKYDTANVLSLMGRYMEKLMTQDEEAFQRHRVGSDNPVTEEERAEPEAFHYSTTGDFLLRSQLDAHDARLPGDGMFDLKTRAVVPVRMDTRNFTWGMDYEIRSLRGEWQSFEREYHDMIRSTMLKYSLQVRMGRMDGIFVAFHNIARIFGFQYIGLDEMDHALHGHSDRALGDKEFLLSLGLMNKIFDRAVEKYPNQSIRFHFEARDTKDTTMYIFAEPVTEEQADAIQATNKEAIRQWEESILSGGAPEETSREHVAPSKIGGMASSEEKGQDVTSALLDGKQPADEAELSGTDAKAGTAARKSPSADLEETLKTPFLCMILTFKSFVDGKPVVRPVGKLFTADSDWHLHYDLVDVDAPKRAASLYAATKARREKEMSEEAKKTADEDDYFRKILRSLVEEGRAWRKTVEKKERDAVVRMWDDDRPPRSASPSPVEEPPLK